MDTFTNGAPAPTELEPGRPTTSRSPAPTRRGRSGSPGATRTHRVFYPDQKTYWKYSAELTKGFYFALLPKALRQALLPGRHPPRPVFPVGLRPLRIHHASRVPGWQRAGGPRRPRQRLVRPQHRERKSASRCSTTRPLVTNTFAGYDGAYFWGAGISTAFNGPWDNTRVRGRGRCAGRAPRRERVHDQSPAPEAVLTCVVLGRAGLSWPSSKGVEDLPSQADNGLTRDRQEENRCPVPAG